MQHGLQPCKAARKVLQRGLQPCKPLRKVLQKGLQPLQSRPKSFAEGVCSPANPVEKFCRAVCSPANPIEKFCRGVCGVTNPVEKFFGGVCGVANRFASQNDGVKIDSRIEPVPSGAKSEVFQVSPQKNLPHKQLVSKLKQKNINLFDFYLVNQIIYLTFAPDNIFSNLIFLKIMRKGFLSLLGAGALLAAFALNLNYAVNDYGVIDMSNTHPCWLNRTHQMVGTTLQVGILQVEILQEEILPVAEPALETQIQIVGSLH
jgi:hypothetical protein